MTSANDMFAQAISLLERGELEAAFPLYEARIDHSDWVPWAVRDSVIRHRDRLLQPGDPVADRDVVVFTEQGLGDNIMFARYLALLAARGARVTLACPPALQPIFERIDGVHAVLAPPVDHPAGKLNLSAMRFDAFAPLMSLPHVFGTMSQTIPSGAPYLHIEPARIAAWRERYAAQGRAGRRRVGLVFQSESLAASAKARSLPLDLAIALADIDDIDLVNLQPGKAGRTLISGTAGVIDAMAGAMPLDEYAAAIAATDLLISVDTMAAHCAAAMGHPVWVVLPRQGDWRWGRGPTRTPWYASAELFRQEDDGGWRPVIDRLRQRLAASPDREAQAAAAIERGIEHHRRQELEAAIDLYRAALVYDPNSAQALCNLGLAYAGLLRHEEALAALEEAQRIAPQSPLVRLNKAQLLLLLGRWREGWEEYEWRWKLPRRQRSPLARSWDGSPVGSRTLLLFSELGLGDTIQMLRYLPLVAGTRDGGGRVLLACQPALRRLLSVMPGIEVVQDDEPLPYIDAELPLCSLPRVFATRPDAVPPQPDNLFTPTDGEAAALVRAAAGPRIGLVWAGDPGMLNDDIRSMPLTALAPLIQRPGPALFSLQKGAGEAQLAAAGYGDRLTPLGPLLHDMADTAAAIHEMDLVITVCTSVAHLAASLNKPTWLMLSYPSEWRWLLGREDTPWYPSMRIFRQERRGDWGGVVARISRALEATPPMAAAHRGGSAG